MPSTSRRSVLAAVPAVGLGGLAGCIGAVRRDSANTDPADRRVSLEYEPGPDEWIRPHRDLANVAVAPDASPPRDAPDERWARETDRGVASLAVADGVVYAGSHGGVAAFSLADGEHLWNYPEGAQVTVIDGRCYARSAERVVALEATTGEVVWDHDLERAAGDLLEVDGTVYYATDDGLHGLHADTGEKRWTVEAEAGGLGQLAVAEGRLHWLTRDAYRVLEPNGGERPEERAAVSLREFRSRPEPATPALADGTAYAGGWGSGITGRPGAVRSLSERGVAWHRPFEPGTHTPTPLDDRLLVAGFDNAATAMGESRIAALDPETGDVEWETTVPEPVGPPAVADAVAYLGGANPGEPSITVEVGDEADDGRPDYEGRPPAETGGLFAVDAGSGERLWELEADGGFAGHRIALVDDAIVLGTGAGVVVLE